MSEVCSKRLDHHVECFTPRTTRARTSQNILRTSAATTTSYLQIAKLRFLQVSLKKNNKSTYRSLCQSVRTNSVILHRCIPEDFGVKRCGAPPATEQERFHRGLSINDSQTLFVDLGFAKGGTGSERSVQRRSHLSWRRGRRTTRHARTRKRAAVGRASIRTARITMRMLARNETRRTYRPRPHVPEGARQRQRRVRSGSDSSENPFTGGQMLADLWRVLDDPFFVMCGGHGGGGRATKGARGGV